MLIERRCRLRSGRANNPLARGEQTVRSGRTIRWLGANNPTPGLRKTRPKPIIYSIYRAQEVYPLSPLLGGGFPKEGGDACSTVNSFCIGGGCAASGEVSKTNKMFIERRRRLQSGRASSPPGVNNPFARGEQSVGSGPSGPKGRPPDPLGFQ